MDVSEVISDLDDHGFSDVTSARKVEMINEVIGDITGREPWPFLEASIGLTFNGSSGIPTNMPSDFRAALKLFRPSDGGRLEWWRMDDFYESFSSQLTLSGTPYLYFFEGNNLSVWQIPSNLSTVTMKYIKAHPEVNSGTLEAAILIPARYHRALLVNGTAQKLALMEDDLEMSREFERLYEKALSNMRADLWRKQYDQPDFIHVFSDN